MLRVAFPVAETGFDPQAAGDVYSNYVNRAIFDPLYKYDYLARPYKLVPNTAAALPEISADGLTWTIRVKPGIYFADDPAFKGQRRELTAADYVYSRSSACSTRRCARTRCTIVDGRFVGADALVAKAKETGKFDYDAPIEGLQALDRYTLRFKLNFPDYELLANLTTTSARGGRARSHRGVRRRQRLGDGQPGRHRPVPAQGMAARPADRARGQSRLSRRALSRQPPTPPTARSSARLARPQAAADRRASRSASSRNRNPRLLAFEQSELDYVAVPPDLVAERARRRTTR